MKQEELQKLIDGQNPHTPVRQIELELGMPKTTIQKALKGERNLPKKWVNPLKAYFDSPKEKVSRREVSIEQVVELQKLIEKKRNEAQKHIVTHLTTEQSKEVKDEAINGSKWKTTEVKKPPPGLTVNQQLLWKKGLWPPKK